MNHRTYLLHKVIVHTFQVQGCNRAFYCVAFGPLQSVRNIYLQTLLEGNCKLKMGNENSTAKNIDKRSAASARQHGESNFKPAISKFVLHRFVHGNFRAADLFFDSPLQVSFFVHEEYAANDQENRMKENVQTLSHKVFLRKKPLFQSEEEKGEFDVVTVTCFGRQALIHDARMHPDFLSMFIDNHSYNFHAVFTEETNNEQVYNEAVKTHFHGVLRGCSTATVRFPELPWSPVHSVLIQKYTVSSGHAVWADKIWKDVHNHVILPEVSRANLFV